MQKALNSFPMGSLAKDVITNFEGVIVCKTEWLTGCDQIGLRPTQLDKDGKPQDSQFFDVTRIQILADPTEEVQRVVDGNLQGTKVTGGPQDTPSLNRG
jgi:hypothetical protein